MMSVSLKFLQTYHKSSIENISFAQMVIHFERMKYLDMASYSINVSSMFVLLLTLTVGKVSTREQTDTNVSEEAILKLKYPDIR